jgi:hypothetical protein
MIEPVTVIRPSGKMTSASPSFTSLMRSRVASGRVGSSGKARTSFRKGFTHQRWAIEESMAKIGSLSSSAITSGASRKLTWLIAMTVRGPAALRCSAPFTSTRNNRRNTSLMRSRSTCPWKARPTMTATTRDAAPISASSAGALKPATCSTPMITAPLTMKAAFSTLLPAMTRARCSSPASLCT